MLQAMQAKVTKEGDKEKELYAKFMCYCQTNGGSLSASVQSAEDKIPAVGSEIKASEEKKVQLQEDTSAAQADRDAAKAAMAEATSIRDKESAAYAAFKAEYSTNIEAISKAVAALEKGVAGSFLQTRGAQAVQKIVSSKDSALADEDRQMVVAFFEGKQRSGYAPQSGQI